MRYLNFFLNTKIKITIFKSQMAIRIITLFYKFVSRIKVLNLSLKKNSNDT